MNLLALSLVIHLSFANKTTSNTWRTIPNTNIPSPIYGHSIGIFNNELYIIGGDYSPQFPSALSTSLYHRTIYNYNVTNYTQITWNTNTSSSTWKSIANMVDHRFLGGFKCNGQCYTTYNQYLYIINPESFMWDEHGFLLIYNMENTSFVNSTKFNSTLKNIEPGICATNNGTHIFAIGGKCHGCSAAHSEIQGLEMNTNGSWSIVGDMNIGRYFSGCNVDKNGEYLYIFGGYLNHNSLDIEESGDVSDYIEKCALFEHVMTCYNVTNAKLAIARAEHQVIVNRDGLMFIIGGMNRFGFQEEIVEIYDVSNNIMMNNAGYTYINNGINGFGTFYDEIWDIIYIVGGIDNRSNIVNTIQYFPICQLYDNCYANEVNLQCGDDINIFIDEANVIYSYYFEINDIDKRITSIHFNNCLSDIDTYIYLFKWNDTANDWSYSDGQHYDDNGKCIGLNQESFIIFYPQNGYYMLWLGAHEIGIYSASFLCRNNTFEPTLEPTINPSINPTMNPTIYPTDIPTAISMQPTINPIIYPTEIPTETSINPSINPSITPIQTTTILVTEYDKIWFLLSFICRSQHDLRRINWKLLILNGLFNAFKIDDTFSLHIDIDGNLTYLQNEEMALEIMDRNGRHLLNANNYFYFNIQVNITMNVQYLNVYNESYLCLDRFSDDFVDGLSSEINKIQIYSIGLCDNNLLISTWNFDKIEDDDDNIMDILPIIILLAIFFLIILSGLIIQKLRGIDSLLILRLILFAIYCINVYSDIFFGIDIWIHLKTITFSDSLLISLAIISICIIIIPIIKNIYDINVYAEYWQSDLVHGLMVTEWLDNYGKFVYLLSFICCSTYGVIELVNSNLFGLRLFSMGLSPASHQRFGKQRFWVFLLANLPQLTVQIILMAYYFRMDRYSIFALITSILSILIYLYLQLIPFNYNDSDNKSMLFSLRISSVSIVNNTNFYSNKCSILGEYLSSSLNIKKKEERLDILPSQQYFDTDIGGLEIYILITTKLDKHQDDYLNMIQELMSDNILSLQIGILWNISTSIEDINCYRLKGITNTSQSMQMTLMNYHPSKSRLTHHIKVNSGPLPITEYKESDYSESHHSHSNKTDDDDDGVGTSTSPQRGNHEKTKRDFIVLNTNDDDQELEEQNNIKIIEGQTQNEQQYELGFAAMNQDLL